MSEQNIHANGQQTENAMKISETLLGDIDKVNERRFAFQTADLSESWNKLRGAIHSNGDKEKFADLKEEFEHDKEKWIDDLYEEWIHPGSRLQGRIEFARLAAIRMLAIIAGSDPSLNEKGDQSYADYVFDKLWSVIENKEQNFTVDARAWALLSLDTCNLEMNADRWERTFGVAFVDEDGTDDYWLETVPEAKIRAESINAIGKMAKFAERAKCWQQTDRDACSQELGHFRLNDDLFEEVEMMILTHWGREIDYEVKRHLVVALGYIAGWTRLPKPDSWDVIDMLREAANWTDERTRNRVPWAIRCIANNIIHRRDGISWQQSSDALKRLVDLAVDNVKQIEKNFGKERYSRGYDLQRQYILTMRHIALSASAEQTLKDEGLVDFVVDGLFRLADCADHQKEVRQLSLYFLNEIGCTIERAGKVALERYKLMLADPEPEIANNAASNIVTLLKDRDAANYFVDIVLEDRSIDDAIQHRQEKWNIEDGTDIDYLKMEIRKRAAQMLGTINDNGEAHDKLVEMLRSDTMKSGRARDALIVIGGERAVESIVHYNLQQQVTDRFFRPMEEAQKRGWTLLKDVRKWTNNNYRYAYWAALVAMSVGILILVMSAGIVIYSIFSKTNLDLETIVTPAIGLLLTIVGHVGTNTWEPAKGLNKVASELSRLIMSFENYLGRMRLIGLGFAHAYTQNNFEQLLFLSRISEITADAMRESAMSLEDLGEWPKFDVDKRFVTVPALIDNSLESARDLVEQTKLEMIIGDPEYNEDKNPGTIIAQDPPAGVYVAIGSKIKVSPSTNQRPVVKVPDFTGKTILEAVESVQDDGIELGSFQFQFDVDAEEGTIITQDLRTGLHVSQGTAINLTIAKRVESSEEI